MTFRKIDTVDAYFASLLSACAGAYAVWLYAHLWGVPSGETAHSESAALLAALATVFVLGTIAYVEVKSDYE